ncbi:MAG: reverse transcriptase domain-containing protein, partial [Thermoguttaceae bacterium]
MFEKENLDLKKNRQRGRPASSNLGQQDPNDGPDMATGRHNERFSQRENRDVAYRTDTRSKTVKFKKGSIGKEIAIELALLEWEDGFMQGSLKDKLARIAQFGDMRFKEWLIEKIAEDNFSGDWDDIKKDIKDFCTSENIGEIRKYKDETWSAFLMRLVMKAQFTNTEEGEIRKRLTKMVLPKTLEILLIGTDYTISDIAEKYKEHEQNYFQNSREFSKKTNFSKNNDTSLKGKTFDRNAPIKCFVCDKIGHMSFDCPSKKDRSVNHTNIAKHERKILGLDYRAIKINGIDFCCLFDSAAAASIIDSRLVEQFGWKAQKLDEPFEFTLLNGTILSAEKHLDAKIEFEGHTKMVDFYILDNITPNTILISFDDITEFTIQHIKKTSEIPIKCAIKTTDDGIVSWTRPIRTYSDRMEFESIIQDLLDRQIIEKSNSLWLNPVVLTKKKTGELRFCVDFRRLNDKVLLDGFNLPKINELLSLLHGMTVFSVIDLKDGFYHIDIEPCDKEKTTFSTGNGLYQFVKMPQGYKNAPGIFQRAMTLILEGLI